MGLFGPKKYELNRDVPGIMGYAEISYTIDELKNYSLDALAEEFDDRNNEGKLMGEYMFYPYVKSFYENMQWIKPNKDNAFEMFLRSTLKKQTFNKFSLKDNEARLILTIPRKVRKKEDCTEEGHEDGVIDRFLVYKVDPNYPDEHFIVDEILPGLCILSNPKGFAALQSSIPFHFNPETDWGIDKFELTLAYGNETITKEIEIDKENENGDLTMASSEQFKWILEELNSNTSQQGTDSSSSKSDKIEQDNLTSTSGVLDKASEIRALHKLYEDKILTKEEFEQEKIKILNR